MSFSGAAGKQPSKQPAAEPAAAAPELNGLGLTREETLQVVRDVAAWQKAGLLEAADSPARRAGL